MSHKKLSLFGLAPVGDKQYYCYIQGARFNGISYPIYVGKGKGSRFRDHWGPLHRGTHSNLLFQRLFHKYSLLGGNWFIQFLTDDVEFGQQHAMLLEEDAFNLEIKLIQHFGRRDIGTGVLANLTGGGPGTRNRLISEEEIQALSYGSIQRWQDPIYRQHMQIALLESRGKREFNLETYLHSLESAQKAREVKLLKWNLKTEEEKQEAIRLDCEQKSARMRAWWAKRKAEKVR